MVVHLDNTYTRQYYTYSVQYHNSTRRSVHLISQQYKRKYVYCVVAQSLTMWNVLYAVFRIIWSRILTILSKKFRKKVNVEE
jgi:hypothetical protein